MQYNYTYVAFIIAYFQGGIKAGLDRFVVTRYLGSRLTACIASGNGTVPMPLSLQRTSEQPSSLDNLNASEAFPGSVHCKRHAADPLRVCYTSPISQRESTVLCDLPEQASRQGCLCIKRLNLKSQGAYGVSDLFGLETTPAQILST